MFIWQRLKFFVHRCGVSLALLGVVFFACTGAASAQQDVGYISGTVTDSTGSVIPNAKARIVNTAQGTSQDVETNSAGFYQSSALPPGTYAVTVTMQGFKSYTIGGIVVDAAAHVTSNATLAVGSMDTSVTVESTPPSLDTVDAQIGNTVDARAVQELPVNGRSVLALATLSPGVVSAAGSTNQGFTNRGTQASALRISGGVPGGNNNLLDGVSNLQNYLGEVAINIKADSVQEFRIMTGVIPAQFGYTSGGVINVITRSGANRVHGSIYEFFRNDYLDARQARPVAAKQPLRFNNYGATLGGPIRKDRAFFFGNYEEYRYVTTALATYSVPTVQERGGDFSDLCNAIPIYDPQTGSATTQRTQYQGNKIPSQRLDPVAVNFLNTFVPTPNNSSGSYNPCTHENNYVASPKLVSNERTIVGRVDDALSSHDTIFGRYAYYQNYTNNGNLGFGPIYYRNDTLTNYDAMLAYTHTFSPQLQNDLRAAVLRSGFPFQAATAYQNFAAKIGLPGVGPDVAPVFNVSGLPSLNGTVGFRASTTIELLDDVSRILGDHTLHFGFDGRFAEGFNNQANNASGAYGFSANQTAQGSDSAITAGTGNVFASLLSGAVSSANVQLSRGIAYRQYQFAGYAQDDWHAGQRLTLNVGLRWDYQQQAHEKKNGLANFDITRLNTTTGYLGQVEYAGQNGNGTNFVHENWFDFGPRVGFALVLTDDNKTVMRGGYAIYYPTVAQTSYDQAAGNFNGFGQLTTSYSAPSTYGQAFTLKNGVPSPAVPPQGTAAGQIAFRGQTGYYSLPRARTPQSMQYTLTVSRELPWKTVLDVSYLGNHGRYFNLGSVNINTLDPSYFPQGQTYLNTFVPNPYAGQIPENSTLNAATITRANLLKPYPYMSQVQLSNPRASHFDGNFLYVTAQRRAAEGLQYQASYTYGKLMSLPIYTDVATTTGITQTGAGLQNWRNLDSEYSVDAIDVTHRGIVAVLYDLPFGRGKHWLSKGGWTDRVFGGFQFNTTMTLESGRPLGFTGANNGGTATRPNFDPSKLLQNPTSIAAPLGKYRRFNFEAFSNPAVLTFGNAPRYYSHLRGPGVINFDMSVFKTTRITEGTDLELRLEAFNAFNHANPASPSVTYSSTNNSNMGVVSSTLDPRRVQLAAKFHF